VESEKIAILGAGSIRCGVPVIASLATYFGERPLSISLWDADAERLELFEMFAGLACVQNKNPHELSAVVDVAAALENAVRVILMLDPNCALLEAKKARASVSGNHSSWISATVERLVGLIPGEAQVMSLLPAEVRVSLPHYYRLDWPPDLEEDEARSMPHQVLRWIRGDEYMFEVFNQYDRSPLKTWLDDVTSATVISEY
jgi:hypothetical protein